MTDEQVKELTKLTKAIEQLAAAADVLQGDGLPFISVHSYAKTVTVDESLTPELRRRLAVDMLEERAVMMRRLSELTQEIANT